MQQDAINAVADVFRIEGGSKVPDSTRQQVLLAVPWMLSCAIP